MYYNRCSIVLHEFDVYICVRARENALGDIDPFYEEKRHTHNHITSQQHTEKTIH